MQNGDNFLLISFETVRSRKLSKNEEFYEEINLDFMAPELLNINEIVLDLAKCDYFALGGLIYELLTGKIARNREEMLKEVAKIAGIDEKLWEIIQDLLRNEAESRKLNVV